MGACCVLGRWIKTEKERGPCWSVNGGCLELEDDSETREHLKKDAQTLLQMKSEGKFHLDCFPTAASVIKLLNHPVA